MSKPFIFSTFMRKEFALYSREYATDQVSIIGEDRLNKTQGGVFLFLHFGNFFSPGVHKSLKKGLIYNDIESFAVDPKLYNQWLDAAQQYCLE